MPFKYTGYATRIPPVDNLVYDMIRLLFCALSLSVLFNGMAHAGINDGLVEWLAHDANFTGLRQLEFHPVVDHTGKSYDLDVAAKASQALQQKLTQAGITLTDPGGTPPKRIVLETRVVFYQPGSVGGRWVGFGGGAAVCILRSRLIHGESTRLLGDFTGAYQVQAGGLFSAGAEKRVPSAAAGLIAKRIIELMGLEETGYEDE